MESVGSAAVLEAARVQSGLSNLQLWIGFIAVGGTANLQHMMGFLRGADNLDRVEEDMLVHVLNERFTDLDLDHPVPYVEDRDLSV